MSNETLPQGGHDRTLVIGGAVAILVLLLSLTIAMVLIFALRSDVAALEDQARKSAKATKALQDELAELQETVAAAAKRAQAAEPRPGNIDAADTKSDCVIRPGSKGSLADCMNLSPTN